MTPTDWLIYQNQGAIRSRPISDRLQDALSFLPDLGVQMRVFSGGQAAKGSGGARTGSTRHDHGEAADVFFYKDGRQLDWANDADRPIFEDIVRRARSRGVTGFGAGDGYMRPGSMHIGFGNPAVWGAGGKGANAPGWLRAAFSGGAGSNEAPRSQATELRGSDAGDTLSSNQTAPSMAPASLLEVPNMDTTEQRSGGLLGDWFTPDKRDRMILALEGMTLNPNRGLMMAAADGIQERSDARKEARAEQKAVKRTNRTLEWLNSQGDYGRRLAQAVSTGGLNASEAVKLVMSPQKDDRTAAVRNYEYARSQGYAGSFQDFQNGDANAPTPYSDAAKLQSDLNAGLISQEVYDAQVGQLGRGDESAPEASIRRIMEAYSVDRRTATGIVDGTLRVSRDPVDDTVIVTDLATRESYRPGMPDDTTQPASETPQRDRQELSFPSSTGADASDAFGLEGMLKGGANAVSDYVGLDAPFEGVRETQSDFAVLSESLINDVASAYDRQPPSWLLENIRELTPQAGGFQGAGAARSRLGALRRNFENELNIADEQLGRRMSPAERQSLLSRRTGLEAAIAKVDSYLGRFGGSEGNTTQSGVSWSVVE
ncbi:hypothetical protein LVO79_16760 [Roseivivax marinus]|uniref:hypothetical protein n=1 Tax=Roseivivax marinus TaxID=1379903 RepID=UPI001F039E81|nr:hypothetical protein [Roseivivax marinus]UMA64630.1 hypothetical protein LVO79_16760 [Roseivivax marinus]